MVIQAEIDSKTPVYIAHLYDELADSLAIEAESARRDGMMP
jgi:hypothetical protein